MTHTRYWASSLAVAIAGGFLAIDRFAFAPHHAVWIAFGVAIGAAVFALAATGVALARENQAFSGISALSALLAGWTIIATRTFVEPTALWLVFAGGIALVLLSVRALALHETTVERVVHALELNGSTPAIREARRLPIGGEMRSWIYWLTHTGLAVVGAFLVLITFAWSNAAQVSLRWTAFAIGIAAAALAVSSLLARLLARDPAARGEGGRAARMIAILLTGGGAAVAAGLIVTMATLHGVDARWTAFGLGAGMVGVSLLASLVHELTSERVRHELEVEHAATPAGEPTFEALR
jgi:hypothetical protein